MVPSAFFSTSLKVKTEPAAAMVQKSDGGFPYLATDLAALRFRHRMLEANEVLYVVGASQQLHLRQVFAVARAAGFVPETLKPVTLPLVWF